MQISYELDLNTFKAWSGAVDTLERIRSEGKCEVLEQALEEIYPDGMEEGQLNDLLWFDSEFVYGLCGIMPDLGSEFSVDFCEETDEGIYMELSTKDEFGNQITVTLNYDTDLDEIEIQDDLHSAFNEGEYDDRLFDLYEDDIEDVVKDKIATMKQEKAI